MIYLNMLHSGTANAMPYRLNLFNILI